MNSEALNHVGVLNFAAKYLSRRPNASVSEYAESWRFPLVDTFRAGKDITAEYRLNRVTFVWVASAGSDATPVSVVGTFDDLWDRTPLATVKVNGEPTAYRAVTVLIPKGQVHTYKFLVDGKPILDPINPQRTIVENGVEWSRFFTQMCAVPLTFEDWEIAILTRLTNEILPFEGHDAQQFMNLFYANADTSFDGWRPEHYYNENIASVLPWIANVILRTIQTCNGLVTAFGNVIQLSPEIAPGYLIYVRGPHTDALVEVLKVHSGGSPWWTAAPAKIEAHQVEENERA